MKQPRFARIRRNHALEHATIHVLSGRFPNKSFIGRSDPKGFFLYGDITRDEVHAAADEALARLRRGDAHLAIHPNCGTNLVTSGLLAGSASYFALIGIGNKNWRQRLERLPMAITLTMISLIIAQPLGKAVQKHVTTDGDPGQLEIIDVREMHGVYGTTHRVLTLS
ncbi:MAG: DUF6391 domain-containing protein [Anaerolineales bacterium]